MLLPEGSNQEKAARTPQATKNVLPHFRTQGKVSFFAA